MLVESVVQRNFAVVFCEWEKFITLKPQKTKKSSTYQVLCGTSPTPSSDAISVPAPRDAVFEGEASTADELAVSAAYT